MGREAETVRVPGEIAQSDRMRLQNQQAQDAMAFGQVSDGLYVLGRDAHVHELRQPVASLREDAEGAIAGADDLHGGRDNVAQDVRERQICADAQHGGNQGTQPIWIADLRQRAHGWLLQAAVPCMPS